MLRRVIRPLSNCLVSHNHSIKSNSLPLLRCEYHTSSLGGLRKELPYMVSDDTADDPSDVKIPYLKDEKRQEMFSLHIDDPERWSIQKLSQHYGTSLERTSAVIFLMQSRHDLIMGDLRKIFNYFPEDENLQRSCDLSGTPGVSRVVHVSPGDFMKLVPASLLELFNLYTSRRNGSSERSVGGRDLISNDDEKGTKDSASDSLSSLLTELQQQGDDLKWGFMKSMEEENVLELLNMIERHSRSQYVQEYYEQHMAEKIGRAREMGVDVNTFREPARSYRSSKATNITTPSSQHVTRSFQLLYYPDLLRDDTARSAQVRLLKRIEQETKAQLEHDVEYYENMYGLTPGTREIDTGINGGMSEAPVDVAGSASGGGTSAGWSPALPSSLQQHEPLPRVAATGTALSSSAGSGTDDRATLKSRWKLAFQDLSLDMMSEMGRGSGGSTAAAAPVEKSMRIPARTVIRTRNGRLRYATPLEESKRSWRIRPRAVDAQLANILPHYRDRLVAPYLDPDQDEEAVLALRAQRKSRRATATGSSASSQN